MWDIMKELDGIINDSGCDISLLVKELDAEKPVFSQKSDVRVVSASTIKLPVLLAALELVKRGALSLDKMITVNDSDILPSEVFEFGQTQKSLLELLYWMIINSDNTAANVVIRLLGFDFINEYIKTVLGCKNTVLERYMIDPAARKRGLENYTSMDDQYRIYYLIYNKKILNDELCETAKTILYAQRKFYGLMRHLYEPFMFAHKGGTLDYINLDAGVMEIGDKKIFVGVSLRSPTDPNGNRKILGQIGRTVYYYYKNE